MIKVLLQTSGWLIAHTPEWLWATTARVSGPVIISLIPRRKRLLHSNLHHAFPERSEAWRRKIGRDVGVRLMETAFLSLASPFFSAERIRSIVVGIREDEPVLSKSHPAPFPLMVATAHLTYWESLTWMKLFSDPFFSEIAVIFRPLNNEAADAWVKATRERFGLTLLSRKVGLQEAFKILKRNGLVGLLFDQNAGNQGALTTLFGRVCSTSELLGALAEKYHAKTIVLYPVRTGFWKLRFETICLAHDGSGTGVTLALNRWLENACSQDDNLCASWLWSHDRWRNQDVPSRRFRLEAKRNLLAEDLRARGLSALPRKTRFWIRLPNWLGDVVMALPLLRSLRISRPDAEITVIAKGAFAEFLTATGLADRVLALPPKGGGYFQHFWRWRKEFPDVYVLFTNSFRGDLEAWLTRAPQRFGVRRAKKSRPMLTHHYQPPAAVDESSLHQLETWEAFFRHFGNIAAVDCSPLVLDSAKTDATGSRAPVLSKPAGPIFGLIAGSENTPAKRWPVAHWRALIELISREYSEARFILLGTAKDQAITGQIAGGQSARVTDLAGKTDLLEFARRMRGCSLLISNDTGGMHLANAIGVPVVALFGPTNPLRTKPVFTSPIEILQPPACPPTGGGDLAQLLPKNVFAVVRRILPRELARI